MQNRTIKFRAWDGVKMNFDCIVARPQSCNVLAIMTDEDFAKSQYGLVKWKVMQYTGLKDKNGVEIFEGDIVKGAPFAKKAKVSYIIYRHVGFSVKDESFGWEGEEMWDWDEIEVIGNVYQNSDLLK